MNFRFDLGSVLSNLINCDMSPSLNTSVRELLCEEQRFFKKKVFTRLNLAIYFLRKKKWLGYEQKLYVLVTSNMRQ